MLDAVVANFIDTVGEREFDAPFMALLRARGYYDIHFLHGQFEFGKDFIAKRVGDDGTLRQYVFQSKAGDLNLGQWTRGLGQIEMLRRNQIAHPSFDATLPRKAVFTLTGRLVGGAAPEAQDYCRQCIERGETLLEIWDRERLIEFVRATINVGLAERTEGPLLGIVAAADAMTATDQQIEEVTRRWCDAGQEAWPCVLEAAIIAARLQKHRRVDLSAVTGLAMLRAACFQMHGSEPPDSKWLVAADLARRIFATHAKQLWDRMPAGGPDPATMITKHGDAAALVTVAVRCVRLAELVGLLGLMDPLEGLETPSADAVGAWISRFLLRAPPAASPISDHWATSIIPPVLLLVKSGRTDRAADHLRDLVLWVSQRYGKGIGLADANVKPIIEVRQVIGNVVPPNNLARRSQSLLAATVLDLTAFLRLDRLYALARNEFRRVNALPQVVVVDDSIDQYILDSINVSVEVNAPYRDAIEGEWTSVTPHLREAARPRYLERIGRPWDHLAVSAVVRDRYFVASWNDLIAV